MASEAPSWRLDRPSNYIAFEAAALLCLAALCLAVCLAAGADVVPVGAVAEGVAGVMAGAEAA